MRTQKLHTTFAQKSASYSVCLWFDELNKGDVCIVTI